VVPKPINWWLIGGIIAGALIVGLGAYSYRRWGKAKKYD